METDSQVSQLEQALIRQAESLAREHLKNAEAARTRIRAEFEERIKLKEEREVLAAKAEAERKVRRRTQAAETRLAADLDRLRWALTESALAQMRERLRELAKDTSRYEAALTGLLRAAVAQLPAGDLVAEVSAADYARLADRWPGIAADVAPGRQLTLALLERPSEGGVRVRLADNRAQINQTFEARQERLADDLARVVMERLFASAPDLGTLVHG
ncbi:MAG: V-type proton ATPase subunit E [Thiobacillaceae bacterium]|jgi:V/A-type H+-transporting ATPase subunit E|nr:V-type proton ATPase subunit E [Thiobacillaceae bacterium]